MCYCKIYFKQLRFAASVHISMLMYYCFSLKEKNGINLMKFFNLETLSTIIWQQIKRAILPLLAISSIIIFQIPSNSKSSFWFCCYIKQLSSVIEVTVFLALLLFLLPFPFNYDLEVDPGQVFGSIMT